MPLYLLPSEGMDLLCRLETIVCETTRGRSGFDEMAERTVVLRELLQGVAAPPSAQSLQALRVLLEAAADGIVQCAAGLVEGAAVNFGVSQGED